MAEIRDIKYINKDFSSLKKTLVDFTKTYFPDTYNDFSPSSTGMLFMEMASYVGDVLSFYLDNEVQENFIQYARQKENLFNLAYLLGYRPKITSAASTEIDVYQLLPAITDGTSTVVPDYSYCLKLDENTKVSTNTNPAINFLIQDKLDFSFSSSLDPTVLSVYQISGLQPTFYLLKKTRKAISATVNTTTFTFTTPQRFSTVNINASNIIGVLDIIDSDGNKWYEVLNLSQDMVYDSIKNSTANSVYFSGSEDVSQVLKLREVQRRFVTRFLNDSNLQIQFGAGTTRNTDEEIVPNPNNVGIGLPFEKNKLNTAYSPLNFIFTDSYGVAPSNTTLTVRYLTGGGVDANVSQNSLTVLDTSTLHFINNNLSTSSLAQTIFDSVAVTNAKAADGGRDGDNVEELRLNSLGNFQNQLRTVTKDDYIIRALSMPAEYGTIAKLYVESEKLQDLKDGFSPTLNMYVLSYDGDKKLRIASNLLKQNLSTYLSQYRIINDSIKLKDAFIINIGIDFDIILLPNYNNNEVIVKCIQALKEFFSVDKWQINQPIILRDIYVLLDKIEGVQTVKNIKIKNKTGNSLGYSNYAYDIEGATLNNVVYPSIDPMIFELKYFETDIQGRVVPL